ncbi:MAG: tRNA guanosine(34) transglycosylase Tgt [Alphaproteobacteria bacterium]|tara:strand:+ start:309 stop:1430 length:1122 start_codon:yes stop_codon:yes gene_type:complete
MSKFNFTVENTDGKARAGKLETKHGSIQTPVFMPVGTQGSVKAVFPRDLKKLNYEVILANTYHLMLRPGENLVKKMGGLQKFISWNKPILTDSGGYQVWSLSKLRKITEEGINFVSHIDGEKIKLTPELAIQIQEKLNSDISMVLDECTEYPATFERAKQSMELSLRWAERCKKKFKKREGFGLFAIIQGGMFKDLRNYCSEELIKMQFDGYAIGGLSVGEAHDEMIKIVDHSLELIPFNKPRYLMGVGRPIDIINAVERGVDMFDCVLPTRFGRNGRAFTSFGELNLRNSVFATDNKPIDEEVDCFASKNFSRSYLHHLTKNNEILSSMILSLHNLAFYKKMMSDVRKSIKAKNFKSIKKSYLKYHEEYKKN